MHLIILKFFSYLILKRKNFRTVNAVLTEPLEPFKTKYVLSALNTLAANFSDSHGGPSCINKSPNSASAMHKSLRKIFLP